MGGMLCWLTCLITTSAFLPSYLVAHLKLDNGAMGIVMSAIGFGAMAGTIILSALSDRVGRKPVMLGIERGRAPRARADGHHRTPRGPIVRLSFAFISSTMR